MKQTLKEMKIIEYKGYKIEQTIPNRTLIYKDGEVLGGSFSDIGVNGPIGNEFKRAKNKIDIGWFNMTKKEQLEYLSNKTI